MADNRPLEPRMLHILGKAVLYALYHLKYPDLTVEISVGGKYKPDLVSVDNSGQPRFWAESGVVSVRKLTSLIRSSLSTHLVFLRHSLQIEQFCMRVHKELKKLPRPRSAPIEIVGRPKDLGPFINEENKLSIRREDCNIELF